MYTLSGRHIVFYQSLEILVLKAFAVSRKDSVNVL